MSKTILAFTGQVASGKGTACAYFIEKHHATVVKFSTMLRDILDRLYLPQSREHMQEISTVLRQQFGQDLMAKVIAHDVASSKASLVVVDGVRRPEDIEQLRILDNFHLVAIEVRPEKRFERIRSRNENTDDITKTWEQFVREERAESERLIPDLMKQADYTIDNNGDRDALDRQLADLAKTLRL